MSESDYYADALPEDWAMEVDGPPPTAPERDAEPAATVRRAPHSVEAEQSVLGGLLIDGEAWDQVADLLLESDFYRADHRAIYRQMHQLVAAGQPLDPLTVAEGLHNQGLLDEIGGLAYLAELAQNTPSARNSRAYAEVVRERATRRALIGAASEILELGYLPEGRGLDELLADAETRISKIAEGRPSDGGPEAVNPLLKNAVNKIDLLFNSDSPITGLSTGFTDLDGMTSGFQPADLVIVAARPSMGKTTFAMNLVENAMLCQNKPVVVFSMEMPSEQIIMRMLASQGRIDQTRVRTGQLLEEDWPKLSAAVAKIKDRPLFIDDSAGLSPAEVRSRCRKIAREHDGIAMIMIDYLQLMRIPGFKEGRTNEISEISRSLKAIAKEFNCPVIALSQLNRSLEQRPNKRPVNSDLRESGAIEQDADLITFIYRDEVYNEDSQDKGIAEILIGKQRNGPIGSVRLAFQGRFSRFDNLSRESYGNYAED